MTEAVSRVGELLRQQTEELANGDVSSTYKPLPFAPETLEIPIEPVDVPPELRTPAQESAFSEPDIVETPIPVEHDEVPTEPDATPAPYDPQPQFLTIDVAAVVGGVQSFVQVTDRLPYRRLVTVLSIGDAAQATFNFRGAYVGLNMIQVSQGDLPLDISVFPGQELWVTHATAVVQQMSFQVEPRGEGR